MDIVEKLLARIKVSQSGCFEWTSYRDKDGYGVLADGPVNKVRAHRASYKAFRGPVGDEIRVCHHCDNPCCINPAHLFLGTPKDNTQDAMSKGRLATGSRHGKAKMTESDVCFARVQFKGGRKIGSLAREIGVHPRTLMDAIWGVSWRQCDNVVAPVVRSENNSKPRK